MSKKIPLFEINYTQDDIDAVERVIRRGSHWAKGQEVRDFENALAEYVGRKYCLCFNSGCSALEVALRVLNSGVLSVEISPFTYHGVRCVFEESSQDFHYGEIELDTYALANNISCMQTPIAGFPARNTTSVYLEDACQGLGASVDGRMVGSFGKVSILSFCQNKIITTGEGGALLTNSASHYGQAKAMRECNMRMPSMNAALGLSQLQRIDDIIKERRAQAWILNNDKRYPCALKEIKGHFQTYQMYLVKPDVEVPSHVETKMRFEGCELLKEIPLALSREVVAQ